MRLIASGVEEVTNCKRKRGLEGGFQDIHFQNFPMVITR